MDALDGLQTTASTCPLCLWAGCLAASSAFDCPCPLARIASVHERNHSDTGGRVERRSRHFQKEEADIQVVLSCTEARWPPDKEALSGYANFRNKHLHSLRYHSPSQLYKEYDC